MQKILIMIFGKILDELLKFEPGMRDQREIDKESDSFRYPFHIHRIPADLFSEAKYSLKRVFEGQMHIDLCKFANKF